MKKFLSASEIAKIENVSKMTVNRWVQKSVFPNARMVGGKYRIPLEDYSRWRESTKISNRGGKTNERSDVQ